MIFGYTTGHLWLDLIAIVGMLLVVAVIGSPIVLLWPSTGSVYANSPTLIRPVSHTAPAPTPPVVKPVSELERIRAEAAETGELEAIA